MAEFLPPRMPEDPEVPASPVVQRPPELYGDPAPPEPRATPTTGTGTTPAATRKGPGPLGRLISLIVTIGLAWALVVAITAWLLGLFLARG